MDVADRSILSFVFDAIRCPLHYHPFHFIYFKKRPMGTVFPYCRLTISIVSPASSKKRFLDPAAIVSLLLITFVNSNCFA